MIDFNLTVSRRYYGEYLDALGIQHALEEEGYEVRIHELDPLKNLRRPVYTPPCKVNINFHSSYHLNDNAEQNFLFYHEVHDKTGADDPNIPLGTFQTYRGIFTPAKKFAEALGIDHLQMAADPHYYYKVPYKKVPKEFRCDVVFIGNNHRDRDSKVLTDILKELVDKYKVHVYGEGWDIPEAKGLLSLSAAKYAYSGAKVGINVGGSGMVHWGLGTNRLYQMGACGLATVSYWCDAYQRAYYPFDGMKVAFSMYNKDMAPYIKQLLENEKERKVIAKKFHNQTIQQHLWKHRIKDLLRIIEKPNRGFRAMPLQDNQIDNMKCAVDILVGIPGDIKDKFATSMMMMATMGEPKIKFDVYMPNRAYDIAEARNQMVQECLHRNYKYLLMIDNDLSVGPHALDYFLEDIDTYDLDVVCGWYKRPEPNGECYPHFYVDDGTGNAIQAANFNENRPIRAFNSPPGMMMISRRVLQAFYDNNITPFIMTPKLSEGPYFCQNAKELGFEIWVDPRIFCIHIKHALLERDGVSIL